MTTPALWHTIESRLDSSLRGWRRRVEELDQVAAVQDRARGRAWSDDEVFEGLLMAVLSANTDWSKIEWVQRDLAELFSGFSLESYAGLPACEIDERIVPWFEERNAGSMVLERNLVYLIRAARILFEHSRAHGTAESYFTSLVRRFDGDPKQAVLRLGREGEYKLPAFGEALAAEALKNLGFDVAKPDRHVMRAVGSFGLVPFEHWPDRSGRGAPRTSSRKLLLAVMKAVEEIARAASTPVVLVDNAIWMLCAKSGLHLSNPQLAEIARESGGAGRQAKALGALIQSWADREDDSEQRETIACLVEGLDRDRLSERKLFPEELKGRSW